MATFKIEGGYYTDNPHRYEDENHVFVPSLTQCLKLQGLSSYEGVDPDDLANASRRGTEVHDLAFFYTRYGDVDPDLITDECRPYFDGLVQFFSDRRDIIVDQSWSERPVVTKIFGMPIGMKPDLFGTMGRDDCIIEFKATSAAQDSHSIQTALQEVARYKSTMCGRARRFALYLHKNGKYRLTEHTEHDDDLRNGIAALTNVHRRLKAGQKLWREVGE